MGAFIIYSSCCPSLSQDESGCFTTYLTTDAWHVAWGERLADYKIHTRGVLLRVDKEVKNILKRRRVFVNLCFNASIFSVCLNMITTLLFPCWHFAQQARGNVSVSNLVNKWTFVTFKWNVLGLVHSLRADLLDTPSNFLPTNLHCLVDPLCHLEVQAERRCSQFPDGNSNVWHILNFLEKYTATSTDSISWGRKTCTCTNGKVVESVQWCEYSHLHLLNNRRLSAQVAHRAALLGCFLPFRGANFDRNSQRACEMHISCLSDLILSCILS